MYLGIEIGGTKLQLGVGRGDGTLIALERAEIERSQGAKAIRDRIESIARMLIERHDITRTGIGFGGPIDAERGRTVTSHQVGGWDDFPLVEWIAEKLSLPAVLGNDADVAALAEARYGAGRGANPVFYVTAGTGVGGGLIVDGRIYRGSGAGASEIGHLRPGLDAIDAHQTVEALAAGPAIAKAGGDANAKTVAERAATGDAKAIAAFKRSADTLGWAIAQTLTLVAPEVVVVGGGVTLAGEMLFYTPLREAVERYVFPPLRGTYRILPPMLGEEMVVHGAIALACD
jgi:glucokinase